MTQRETPKLSGASLVELPLASPPKLPVVVTEASQTSFEGEIDRGNEPWTSGKYGPDWSRAGDDIAVGSQPAIAVYENTHGAVVIRQESSLGDDDDTIIVQASNLTGLIEKLSEYIPAQTVGPAGGRA